ncbi:hypothetical protein LLEC1_04162 [Akanthomyces lecanii]|uniref:Uncharacterized protein n=1 Tax=Cordyceps confragosa TaxID=2714763 RepID=A0A179I6T1_CORDF|nr:hypothetical protein LLEC1_04162 [Akanthomyces lecanii]
MVLEMDAAFWVEAFQLNSEGHLDSGGGASHENHGPDFAFSSQGGDTGRQVICDGNSSYD